MFRRSCSTADRLRRGSFTGAPVSIQDVFEAVGANAKGIMSDSDLKDMEDHACPGPGACGGQFTANTMATACEFLGISPLGSNSIAAMAAQKRKAAYDAGLQVMELLRQDIRPSRILTLEAFQNAAASVSASGGSSNAVLHLAGDCPRSRRSIHA